MVREKQWEIENKKKIATGSVCVLKREREKERNITKERETHTKKWVAERYKSLACNTLARVAVCRNMLLLLLQHTATRTCDKKGQQVCISASFDAVANIRGACFAWVCVCVCVCHLLGWHLSVGDVCVRERVCVCVFYEEVPTISRLCVCVCVCACVRESVCECLYACVCERLSMDRQLSIGYVCVCVCMCMCVLANVRVCFYVCML